jgi:hypothetical protein
MLHYDTDMRIVRAATTVEIETNKPLFPVVIGNQDKVAIFGPNGAMEVLDMNADESINKRWISNCPIYKMKHYRMISDSRIILFSDNQSKLLYSCDNSI